MSEEEEESPLEGPRVRQSCLAGERHAAGFKEQHAADAIQRAGQRIARNNEHIAVDATRHAAQKVAHNDAQIALENVASINARMHLHSNRQQEMCNTYR
jgi:hypothetical protein